MKKAGYDIKFLRNDKGVVCGYSIKRGNSVYKASKLGVGRNLVPSKIIATWQKLHPQQDNAQLQNPAAPKTRTATASSASPVQKPKPVSHSVMKHYDIATNDHRTWHIDLPDFAADIIRQECSLEDAHPWAKIEEVQHTAMLLLQVTWMRLQVWLNPAAAVAVLPNPVGERTKTRMTVSGHTVAQGWRTGCANGQKRKA